jgi:hypothetical protein
MKEENKNLFNELQFFLLGNAIVLIIIFSLFSIGNAIVTYKRPSTTYINKRVTDSKVPTKVKWILCEAFLFDTKALNIQCIKRFGLNHLKNFPVAHFYIGFNYLHPFSKEVNLLYEQGLIRQEDLENSTTLSYFINRRDIVLWKN